MYLCYHFLNQTNFGLAVVQWSLLLYIVGKRYSYISLTLIIFLRFFQSFHYVIPWITFSPCVLHIVCDFSSLFIPLRPWVPSVWKPYHTFWSLVTFFPLVPPCLGNMSRVTSSNEENLWYFICGGDFWFVFLYKIPQFLSLPFWWCKVGTFQWILTASLFLKVNKHNLNIVRRHLLVFPLCGISACLLTLDFI